MGSNHGIHPSNEHPWYWEYDGESVLLVGGSDTDNLFQWADAGLTEHLDQIVEAGGNYVRNTLSDRGRGDVYAFAAVRDGTYDLDRWNDTYWNHLEMFLEETAKRDIVVQLTLWDQHDFGEPFWDDSPWNSHNNINYERYESGLSNGKDIFVGGDRNPVVYPYLRRFVDRVLDCSLEYDHVLYNINNESWAGETWERHWADYVRSRADDAGTDAYVTTMNMWPGQSVATALRNPETFSYVELSQVNQESKGESGQAHWDTVQEWRDEIETELGPRPLNNVKIYGSDEGNRSAGTVRDAIERFWRNLIGGCASVRFHRPTYWGIGLNDQAREHIRSARLLESRIDFFSLEPAPERLSDRNPNEAYCAETARDEYVVYVPDGGSVDIDLSDTDGSLQITWLAADESEWGHERTVDAGQFETLSTPEGGHSLAVITDA